MFNFTNNSKEGLSVSGTEKDEQVISLEAFQGDSALIETVNELNHLKSTVAESTTI